MFKHILVPTDLTERNRRAMDIAVKMARTGDGSITILHVIESIEDADAEELQKFYRQLGTRAAKWMDKFIAEFRGDVVAVKKQILYGRRVKEILNFAADNEVDLIVMSSHKLDVGNSTEGWGTISFKVGILSECPVMLVK
ncbi:MAG: universal stress protein [Desulfobacteraceae bacterium]|nr:universal stress protein [Desulfobacteraceae bacterium]